MLCCYVILYYILYCVVLYLLYCILLYYIVLYCIVTGMRSITTFLSTTDLMNGGGPIRLKLF